ncbi:unnamed protein product [Boreogadus saida]
MIPSDVNAPLVPYPRHYKFILDDAHVCDKGAASPFLVLVVPVAPGNRLARDIIRQTWGKQSVVQAKLVQTVFLLGLPTGADAQRRIDSSQTHDSLADRSFTHVVN